MNNGLFLFKILGYVIEDQGVAFLALRRLEVLR